MGFRLGRDRYLRGEKPVGLRLALEFLILETQQDSAGVSEQCKMISRCGLLFV